MADAPVQQKGLLDQALDWVGLRYPEGDATELYRQGNVWFGFAGAAREQAAAADAAGRGVWRVNDGGSVDAFREWWTARRGPHANLLRAADGAELTGYALHALATEVVILKAAFVAGLTMLVAALSASGLIVVGTGGVAGLVAGAATGWLLGVARRRLLRCVEKAVTVVSGVIVGQLLRNAELLLEPVELADPAAGGRTVAMALPPATDEELLDAVIEAANAENDAVDMDGWGVVDSNGPHDMKNSDDGGLPQTPRKDQERYHVVVRDFQNGGEVRWSINRDRVTGQWGTVKRSSWNY